MNESEEILKKLEGIETRLTWIESKIAKSPQIEFIDMTSDLELAEKVFEAVKEEGEISVTRIMTRFQMSWAIASKLLHYLFFKERLVKTDLGGGRLMFKVKESK